MYKFSGSRFLKIAREAKRIAGQDGSEICGLILDNGHFLELVQVKNKTKTGGGFSFYFSEIRSIKKAAAILGHEIVGTFHSHPVGLPKPGTSDIHYALDDSMMLIFDVLGNTAGFWKIKNKKAKLLYYELI